MPSYQEVIKDKQLSTMFDAELSNARAAIQQNRQQKRIDHYTLQVDLALIGQVDEEKEAYTLLVENREDIAQHLASDNPQPRIWEQDGIQIDFTPPESFTLRKEGEEDIELEILLQVDDDLTEATYVDIDSKNYGIIIIDNAEYLYNTKRLGSGENGSVFEAVNLAIGEEVVLKVQIGKLETVESEEEAKEDEEILLFAEADSQAAAKEGEIGSKYNPDGKGSLGIAVASLDLQGTPLLTQAVGVETAELMNDAFNLKPSTANILVQRRMPGERLGEIDKPPLLIKPVSTNDVLDKIRIAKNLIDVILDFKEQTEFYHMDVRPENILVDSRGQVFLIDPGAAGNYMQTNLVGNTPGFSHPLIMQEAGPEGIAVQLDGEYQSCHEAIQYMP